jgi:hypothetical protein
VAHARHLSDGDLRRFYDDPYSLEQATRGHYTGCADCRARFATIVNDVSRGLAGTAVPVATGLAVTGGGGRRLVVGGLAVAAVATSLVATLALTPLAATVTSVFAPAATTPVAVAQTDIQSLDAMSAWGNVTTNQTAPMQEFSTAAGASTASGLPALTYDTSKLPASVKGAPLSYAAMVKSQGSVTFNASAPANIQGTMLTVDSGAAQAVIYGSPSPLVQAAQGTSGRLSAVHQATGKIGPMVAVIEAPLPRVSSTGASVATIKSSLLAQNGLSPAMQSAISNVDTPAGNLPIPIPASRASASSVTVQGLQGTAYADATGPGNAIVWISNGFVYAVAGTVSSAELLPLANTVNAITQGPTPSPVPTRRPPPTPVN